MKNYLKVMDYLSDSTYPSILLPYLLCYGRLLSYLLCYGFNLSRNNMISLTWNMIKTNYQKIIKKKKQITKNKRWKNTQTKK